MDGVESLSVLDYSRPAVAADGSAFHHIAIVDGGDDLGIITGGRLITQIGYFFGRHGVAGLGPDDVAGIHVLCSLNPGSDSCLPHRESVRYS